METESKPMGSERRRGPRFQVTGLAAVLHVTFTARLLTARADGIVFEATRPLRIRRSYTLVGKRNDGQAVRFSGTLTSCRLTAVRPSASGPPQSVYGAELHVRDEDTSGLTAALPAGLQESLTVDAAYAASVRVLGAYGVLLESELELLVGSSCHIELLLPSRSFGARACVVFVHQVSEGDPPCYHLGLEFHHVPQEEQLGLDTYLATLQA